MSLADRFTEYLAEPSRWEPLAAALESSPLRMEAALLRRYAESGPHAAWVGEEGGTWAGRRVHLGPELPRPGVGELWFDPCELVTMLVVPGAPEEETRSWAPSARDQWRPELSWMSLRPVARWQLAAFLRLAPTRLRALARPPAQALDARRLLAGDEREPVTEAAIGEAALYWVWFGKGGCGQEEWQAARKMLGDAGMAALWAHPWREWAGGLSDVEAYAALAPTAIDIDYRDELDREDEERPPPGARTFFGAWEAPGGVAFRTAVSVRDGLWTSPVSRGSVELLDIVRRDRWLRMK